MLVTLIAKRGIYKIALPKIPIGNYWITDEQDNKLLNIEGDANNWLVFSNSNQQIIELENTNDNMINKKAISEIILKENQAYNVLIGRKEEFFLIYCTDNYGTATLKLNIINNTKEIKIGSSKENEIIYNNGLISPMHARLININGKWMLENFDANFGTFINEKQVSRDNSVVQSGDIIFIMGLKIVLIGNSIFILNHKDEINYNKQCLELAEENNNVIKISNNNDEDEEINLYSEEDYFFKAPRIVNKLSREKLKIDAPPQLQERQEMPMLLTLGMSLSMGAMMIVSMISTIDGRANGTASTKETILSLTITVTMLIGMLLIPILTAKWERRQKVKYEAKRQKRYKAYLNKKKDEINKLKEEQRKILFENYVSPQQCAEIITNKTTRLWERKIEDEDFLGIRLGIGNDLLDVEIQKPTEQFNMEDDNLLQMMEDVANEGKLIDDVPITISLKTKQATAIISQDKEKLQKLLVSVILQLITFHSYEELKLIFLVDKSNKNKWEFTKDFPHVWDNNKYIRFFATDYEDMRKISAYLENVLKDRKKKESNFYNEKSHKYQTPWYLIITDDYKTIKKLNILTQILKDKEETGFSVLCISDNLTGLPNEIETFISIEENSVKIFDSEVTQTSYKTAKLDSGSTFFWGKISKVLSNMPIKFFNTEESLPTSYSFLEMYDVGKIEQLNILNRWKENDTTLSLKVPIGIDGVGQLITLDIHEKYHGPHGIIAGSTGSGKSEFIITYILSMAVNYHPDDVAFVLIDYKGGGLAGAFEKGRYKLPHLIGTITNIDTVGLQRSLISIQSELKRRQIIFNKARDLTDEGTIDIYKYQRLYHKGKVKEAIPHLLIICDEFAELKQQQEEFMNELISVSRIGRSLGVHLILATQKPAGIVDEQIRSNSKFAVCLKVQDEEDSNDVIKRPDAANLKVSGQFYLQVGNGEYFILGQSAWSGAYYYPTDKVKRSIDDSVEFITNIGEPIKKLTDDSKNVLTSNGEQLTNIVKYISELATKEHIKTKSLWLKNVSDIIFVESIRKKYNIVKQTGKVEITIGEYDDPANQKQDAVTYNIVNDGNIIILGNAESGKETLLSTIIYDLMTTYTSEEVNIYILDFGSEFLKIFRDSPHVGDVVFATEKEKIQRLFSMIKQEIKTRKEELSNFNESYETYIKNGRIMPTICVMLNSYETFFEIYEDDFDDDLLILTREGIKCGIIFIFTVTNYTDVRYRMMQNFKNKIALQVNNEDDYINLFDKVGKKRLSHIFGRGLFSPQNDEVYEFQTAKICEDGEYNLKIKAEIEQLNKTNKYHAKPIPVIPDKINLKDLECYLSGISSVPLGIVKKDLSICKYDFKKFMNIITSRNIEEAISFTSYVVEELYNLKNVCVNVFDVEENIQNEKESTKAKYEKLKLEIDKGFGTDATHSIYIIIGLNKVMNACGIGSDDFKELLEKAKLRKDCSFVIVENARRLKDHEFEDWFKDFIDTDNGIWVGNGIEDQFLINVTASRNELQNNCGRSYGYVIKNGTPVLIKLIGINEEEDNNG